MPDEQQKDQKNGAKKDEAPSFRQTLLAGLVTFATGVASGGLGVWLADRIWPENHRPEAVVKVLPATGPAPLTVKLDGSESSDEDGDELTFTWTVDDKTIASDVPGIVTHPLDKAGTYFITLEAKDPDGSVDKTSTAIVVSPPFDEKNFRTTMSLMGVYVERKAFRSVLDTAARIEGDCSLAPKDSCARLHQLKSRALTAMKRFPEAQAAMKRAVDLQPDHLFYSVDYAGLLVANGHFERAVEELNRIIQVNPTEALPIYMLALAEAISAKYEPALSRLDSETVKGSSWIESRAAFGLKLIETLKAAETGGSDTDTELVRAACRAPLVKDMIRGTRPTSEPDLYCLEKLLKRYLGPERDRFSDTLVTSICN